MLRSRPPPQRHGQTWPRSHRECPAPKDVGGWAQATNVPYEHEFLWGGAFLFSDSRGAAQFYSTALPIQPPHDSHSRRSPAAEARAGRRGRQAGAVPPRPPAPDGSAARRLRAPPRGALDLAGLGARGDRRVHVRREAGQPL